MTRLLISACFFSAVALVGCTSSSTSSGEKLYGLKGKLISVDPGNKSIKIDHDDIPGLMKAMRMDLDVADVQVLEGLAASDIVEGKLKVIDGKYLVTELRKIGTSIVEAPEAKDDTEMEIQANLAKLNDEDRHIAEDQKVCPIGEERLGNASMGVPVKIMLEGEPVFLCCSACKRSAERDPDKTLKKVAELKKK